ncbi:MAG: nodulation protein NfeD [Tissierellia bacterium]|nr:nodulation protein NfeD [Tissierellia bacterium]
MKRVRVLLLTFLILMLLSGVVFGEDMGDVYVVPVKGEITRATYNYLRTTLRDIVKNSPEAIIFEIDTYGGLIHETEKIKNLIIDLDVPTISFVNNKAESAGVLITISGEKVVMSPSSTIGSAETIPDTEKVLSMWRGFLRDVAQLRGRDPDIIQAMADSDFYVEGISEKGKLLNLTGQEALEYGIADFISDDYEQMLAHFNIEHSNIVQVEESLEVKLAKVLSSPYLNTLFLTIGFIGMVIEIFTPGFGVGGTISIIAFGLFFGGNILAGNSQWTSLAVFVTGLILLIVEAIVPGFGLPGISGIILVILGAVLAMGSLASALMSISVAIIITAIITILLIKHGNRIPHLDKIVLETSHGQGEKYKSSLTYESYLGKEGISISELRPSGIIEIEGKRLDALSDGTFIPKEANIKVIKVEGTKIIVRRV